MLTGPAECARLLFASQEAEFCQNLSSDFTRPAHCKQWAADLIDNPFGNHRRPLHFGLTGYDGSTWRPILCIWRLVLGPSWASWGHLGPILAMVGHLGAIVKHLGAVLGLSWGRLGASLGLVEPSWGHLGASGGHLGAILERLGAILGSP